MVSNLVLYAAQAANASRSAARREGSNMNKQFGFCERCGAKLAGDKIWWLELDQRTGTYTDQEVPAEFSQGGFAFGKDCAKIMLAEHKAAVGFASLIVYPTPPPLAGNLSRSAAR